MGTTHRRTCLALLGLGALVGGVAASARAQQGSIAGQVTDQATGHPLAGARITIQGTALVTSSNAEGRYTLRNVPAGAITVRATFIGYAAATRGLTAKRRTGLFGGRARRAADRQPAPPPAATRSLRR